MIQAPWKTCSEPWALALKRKQEEWDALKQRQDDRDAIRKIADRMIDSDNTFFRLLVSDWSERLRDG